MSFGVVYAEANQGVRGKGIFEFQFQQDLNKALDKVDGAEHKARKLRTCTLAVDGYCRTKAAPIHINGTEVELL